MTIALSFPPPLRPHKPPRKKDAGHTQVYLVWAVRALLANIIQWTILVVPLLKLVSVGVGDVSGVGLIPTMGQRRSLNSGLK